MKTTLKITVIAVVTLICIHAFAQTNTTLIGRWGYGPSTTSAADSNYLYIGDGCVFTILDYSQPGVLTKTGEVLLADNISDIEVRGQFAYVAVDAAGFVIVNISNPAMPVIVGTLQTIYNCDDVAIKDNYAYLATRFYGVRVIDISNPSQPHEVASTLQPNYYVYSLCIQGNYLYTTGINMHIVNISNPLAPVLTGSCTITTNLVCSDISVEGDYAYIAIDFDGLAIVNKTNLSQPILLTTYNTPGRAKGVKVRAPYAYVADATSLTILNISYPLFPVLTGSLPVNSFACDVFLLDNTAFVADDQGVLLINIQQPSTPVQTASRLSYGYAQNTTIVGNKAYFTDGGLVTFDISNPQNPVQLSRWRPTVYDVGQDVALKDTIAYFACRLSGIRILNVSNPVNPFQIGNNVLNAEAIKVSGNYAYVAAGTPGLRIFDISNPNTMIPTATYNTGNWAIGLDVSGNRVYLADGAVRIFDVTNPGNPVKLGEYTSPTGNGIKSVKAQGNFLYMSDGTYGLRILDISNPASPQLVSSTSLVNLPWTLTVSGDYAYLACWAGGLVIYNISNPLAPVLCGSFQTVDGALGVTVDGNLAYVADRAGGLFVVRNDLIINPFSITSVTSSNISCFGGSNGQITIYATGGSGALSYSINNGQTWQGSGTFSGLGAGSYQIKVKDQQNVILSYTGNPVILTHPPVIVIGNVSTTAPSCNGSANGQIVIAASGGTGALSYTINNGQTWQNSGSFPGLGAGNYQVKVKDQQNCEVIYMGNPVILTQPDSIIIGNVDVIGISCFGSSNGQIYIGASGGTGTLSYSIDNGQTWQSSGFFTGLLPGTYNIKVSDSQNCEAQYTGNPVILQDPPLLWFSSVVTSSISCYGLSDGTITISASGGTGLLRYSIDDGMTWYFNGGVFTGLPAGSYFIKVLDDNSCISIFQNNPVILLEPPEIMISSVQKTDVTAYGLADGTISIEASGGIPPLQYSVDNGLNWQPDSLFTGLAAGNYEIMVVDAIICKVNFPQNPVIINQPAVGMRDDNDALRLSVFPNPASGMVSFSATFSGLEPTSLIITNSLGLSVYHETDARKSFKNGRLVLNCSTWMPGLYHCLLSQHGQVAGAKLVVRSSGAERK